MCIFIIYTHINVTYIDIYSVFAHINICFISVNMKTNVKLVLQKHRRWLSYFISLNNQDIFENIYQNPWMNRAKIIQINTIKMASKFQLQRHWIKRASLSRNTEIVFSSKTQKIFTSQKQNSISTQIIVLNVYLFL